MSVFAVVIFVLLFVMGVSSALGEDPFLVVKALLLGGFSSTSDLGYTIFYATPLIFTGLSVALAFHAGLFNIGAEGQLYIGALFLTLLGMFFNASYISIPLGILAAVVGGGIWAAIAGWIKVHKGGHEVILTIMLNFISYSICGYVIMYLIDNPENQNLESAQILPSYFIPNISENSPANFSFALALIVAILVYWLLYKTAWGFEVRYSGEQKVSAERQGIPVKSRMLQAMFLSGGVAGLVAVNEIMGHSHKFKDQFSGGSGFLGIAVALLARNHPLWIILTAFIFGGLQNGALHLELDSNKITREMAVVIQALLILLLVCREYIWSVMAKLRR